MSAMLKATRIALECLWVHSIAKSGLKNNSFGIPYVPCPNSGLN